MSVLENKAIIFKNDNTVKNTFRPLVKKQMHIFNVEGTILGPKEAVYIVYSFIENGV